MSESEETEDETGEESQTETTETTQSTEDSGSGLDDFVSEGEQAVIKEWVIYVTGIFASIGVAVGLNSILQNQVSHNLYTFSQGFDPDANAMAMFNQGMAVLLIPLSIIALSLLGIVYARYIDNEEATAFKVAAVTSIIAVPVAAVIGGFLIFATVDNIDIEFLNVVVSGVIGGIAAAIGSCAVIWLTENQSPAGVLE